ncbi:hypothetical protein FBY14_110159 [Azospirillum brasilense]|nr:hypothetical protein FBY14_110159 [Azospirillum brasilense]
MSEQVARRFVVVTKQRISPRTEHDVGGFATRTAVFEGNVTIAEIVDWAIPYSFSAGTQIEVFEDEMTQVKRKGATESLMDDIMAGLSDEDRSL